MRGKRVKIVLTLLIVLLVTVFLTACSRAQITDHETDDPAPLPRTTATTPSELTPEPTQTATPGPITLYLSDLLPDNVVAQDTLVNVHLSNDIDADFWFGPEAVVPTGEILQSSTWVYALAAPFPTLVDDISLSDLQAYWLGDAEGTLTSVTRLHVPKTILRVLEQRWGTPGADVEVYQDPPEVDELWEVNAWVILPFENLEPRLKVISVDGNSPVFKEFQAVGYPLAVPLNLVHNSNTTVSIDAEGLSAVINAIQPGNRNPEKMTTLVMTGVTALVRGTAYRMEQNGVLYPGEKIHPWLAEADLTHISNEVSFYEDCPFPDPAQESLFFCSDPSYIELLEFVGADIIELTGNHNNDMLYARGVDVVPFTLDLYEQYGMEYYGGGRDLADAQKPLLVTHNGNRLAFIGCNAFGPDFAWATEEQGGAAPCDDYLWMADEITRLRDEGYLPIATFQYYEDYYNFAAEHHIRDFGLMADAGAVIVNGSQAHRPKAMTFAQDAFIDYGLGNLFFDQRWTIDMYGNVIVQTSWVIIQRHTFYDGRHLHTELLTAMLEDFSQPRPTTRAERELFLIELFEASGWISR